MSKAFFLFTLLSMCQVFASEVTLVSPEGSVKNIKQVTARFSTDMTPLGDPRDTIIPFTSSCLDNKNEPIPLPQSQSRWADTKNWVLDYTEVLSGGTRCTFTMKNSLKDLKGEKVTYKEFTFSTSGPAIISHQPSYEKIEPEQYFIIELDGEVDVSSVEKLAYFEVEGGNEKIELKMINGSDREQIIKEKYGRSNSKELEAKKKNILVVAGKRRFPESKKVVFHWPQGILSKTGMPVTESQTLDFYVVMPFTATFSCERDSDDKYCNPISEMFITFKGNVKLKDLEKVRLTSTDGLKWAPKELNELKDKNKSEAQTTSLSFQGPFPENKKFTINLPGKLKDEIGRTLTNEKSYPLEVRTEEYSPLIKFPARFGVLELMAEPILPVSVRNVEKMMLFNQMEVTGKAFNISSMSQVKEVIALYKSVKNKADYPSIPDDPRNTPIINSKKGRPFKMPKPLGERAFEMTGIPLKDPGFYVVEINSPKLGKALTLSQKPMYVSTSVLVTNMGMHFKKGIESSLVWVTQLNDAKPVAGAAISVTDCNGDELWKGVTNSEGLLKLGILKNVPKKGATPCSHYDAFYIFAKKDSDFSFMSSEWGQGIESWRYQVSNDFNEYDSWSNLIGHTVLDRSLFKPGETVQMKHFFREHHQNGFAIAKPKLWPKSIYIRHTGSGKVYPLPLKIDPKTGTSINSFALTPEMPLGNYEIYFSNVAKSKKAKASVIDEEGEEVEENDYDYYAKKTGSFLLTEFRLPLMAATVKIQGGTLVRSTSANVDLSASYLSGGPASKLKVLTRAQFSQSYFMPEFPGSEEYVFFSTPVKVGTFEGEHPTTPSEAVMLNNLTLNEVGGALLELKGFKTDNVPKKLSVEMEYADPNGEIKTATGSKIIFPSKTIVGLRVDSWFGSATTTKVLGVVTNPEGQLLKGVSYTVDAFKSENFTHRKRLVGGFYSYDSKRVVTSLGTVCSGVTDTNGRFECIPKDLPAGNLELQAKVLDENKAESYASTGVNILAKGEDQWWTPGDSDRIDILAAKKMFAPGETAEFIVKTPYKVSTALITVEREGVLDQFVTTINRDNPVIKVPMKGNYAPNVFISAMLVRGRIGEPKPDFLVDLGKPAMKMGLTGIKVGWAAHQLKVVVETDKKQYNVRDQATVKIKVTGPNGAPLPKNSEVILAAVDEALLQLKANESYDLLAAMMNERGLSVEASSSMNQVIGRRHFGLKAKPTGGGGGAMSGPRENFNPLIAFIPNLKVNENGEVETKIKLNDSISSFRLVAIAHAGADLFGTGKVNIITNKDLILYSGISPVARDGDQIQNVLSVRNTTDKEMKVQMSLKVTGTDLALPAIPDFVLLPSETKVITIPVTVPAKTKSIAFNVMAKDTVNGAHDEVLVAENISASVPAKVLQATLYQLDNTNITPLQQPLDSILGSGGVKISARASLVQGLGGVRTYMEEYPYSCLEQRTSKAIALDDKKAMTKIIKDMPSYIDGDGLLKFFDWPSGCGSAQLTHYILDITHENKIVLPKNISNQLIKGLNNAIAGRLTCNSWWAAFEKGKAHDEQNIQLMESLSRYKELDLKLIDSLNVTPNLWATETLVNWAMILKNETKLAKRDERLKEVNAIIRARVNFQGSTMNLQKIKGSDMEWMLFTSNDQEALGVFNIMMDQDSVGDDAGRMARGLIARLHLGHWDTTMANAWGMTLMKKFSDKFEKVKITGTTHFALSEQSLDVDWSKNPKGDKKLLNWPESSQKSSVNLEVKQNGAGKPWIHLETSAAIPLKAPMNFGYKIVKNITAVNQKTKGKWSVGDVVNVELLITAGNDQSWVVVSDPIPSGASHLGTGLEGESAILNTNTTKNSTENSFPVEYVEKSFSNFTAYAGYLAAGTYEINYRYRINSAGTFKLPPTHAEAMYSPEVFGDIPNAELSILP